MGEYSNEEYADMHLALGAAHDTAAAAARIYAEWFPNRPHPNPNTFRRLDRRLRETGQFQNNRRDAGRPRTTRTPQLEQRILDAIEDAPRASTRMLSRQIGVHHSLIGRVLKTERWHPFHLQKVHTLLPRDYQPRVNFCQWLSNRDNPNFTANILWTDEAIFAQDGIFNCHNLHYWAQENPRMLYERGHQYKYGYNVWAGIVGSHLIGPHIIPNRLLGRDFRLFLETDFQVLIEDLPLNIIRDMWFQLDGAPPHWERSVREWLDENFENRWIGRDGPTPWPARSPDLNPMDYFFWGYMKDQVYATPPRNDEDLRNRLFAAAATVTEEMLTKTTQQNLTRRLGACIAAQGRNFEQLL